MIGQIIIILKIAEYILMDYCEYKTYYIVSYI
jgi:hypothetical protein